jgi:hypothetical protein
MGLVAGDLSRPLACRFAIRAVESMPTGSMASNYWGIPRTTHDLDFVLLMHPSQVDQLVAAFDTGFFIQPESVRSAIQPPYQFDVLDEQSTLKADFWLLRENAFEQSAFGRRVSVDILGVSARIASAEDVILHKLYWIRSLPPSANCWMPPASMLCRPTRSISRIVATGHRTSEWKKN